MDLEVGGATSGKAWIGHDIIRKNVLLFLKTTQRFPKIPKSGPVVLNQLNDTNFAVSIVIINLEETRKIHK